MNFFRNMERMMGLTEGAWMRHANPWSVFTRYSILPLLVLAIWSRDWIGWWSLLPVALAVIWTRVNPHIFPPPATTAHWASRGVMGERVWLNRKEVAIPAHHAAWAMGLALLSGAGLPPLIWGLWAMSLPWTLLGLAISMIGKSWFLDRMVWLFDDMAAVHTTYEDWKK